MKKNILLFCSLLITFVSNAQTKQLWGMTYQGGTNNMGVLFQYDLATNTYNKKLDFDGANNGKYPMGSLIQASNGKLYGMTSSGGANNMGVLFQYDPTTNTYNKKVDFEGSSNGSSPSGSLMQASNGMLYGMTTSGGINGYGVLFQYNPVTCIYTKKMDFDGANYGMNPICSLIQTSDGNLYGMTYQGGNYGYGVLFQYNSSTNTFSKKLDFSGANNGRNPTGSLIQASDGKLYGMTLWGGSNDYGVLFQFDPTTSTYTKKLNFEGRNNGSCPYGSLIQASDGKLYGITSQGGVMYNSGALFQYDPITSICTKKVDFDGTNKGSYSWSSLMQSSDGKLYGMTTFGGTNGYGVLFQYDPSWNTYIKKLDYDGTNGSAPKYTNLIEVTNSITTEANIPKNIDAAKITYGKSFIQAVFEGNVKVELLNMNGIQLEQVTASNTFCKYNLTSGVYILKLNGKAYKAFVK